MSAADDYMQRLRNIREKYGCMHSRKQTSYMQRPSSAVAGTSSMRTSTNFEKSYSKAPPITGSSSILSGKDSISYGLGRLKDESTYDRYGDYEKFDKKKFSDQYNFHEPVSITNTSNRISFGDSGGDYTHKYDRNKQIDQIRQTYAANRRQVMEDYEHKYDERQYGKIGSTYKQVEPRNIISKDLYKLKDYAKADDYKTKSYSNFDLQTRHRATSKTNYLGQQSLSPIKRMSEFVGDTTRKSVQLENVAPLSISPARPKQLSDSFWRERQTKLSELTSNKLNEYRFNNIQDYSKEKKMKTGIYHQQTHKTLNDSPTRRSKRFDLQNQGKDYNVNNIEKIQQRIQSILGNK